MGQPQAFPRDGRGRDCLMPIIGGSFDLALPRVGGNRLRRMFGVGFETERAESCGCLKPGQPTEVVPAGVEAPFGLVAADVAGGLVMLTHNGTMA